MPWHANVSICTFHKLLGHGLSCSFRGKEELGPLLPQGHTKYRSKSQMSPHVVRPPYKDTAYSPCCYNVPDHGQAFLDTQDTQCWLYGKDSINPTSPADPKQPVNLRGTLVFSNNSYLSYKVANEPPLGVRG